MSLQNPSATRLRWSRALLEILCNPDGDKVAQRAAARLLRMLAHPSGQAELERATLLHTERRVLRSLAKAYVERALIPSERTASHFLEHSAKTHAWLDSNTSTPRRRVFEDVLTRRAPPQRPPDALDHELDSFTLMEERIQRDLDDYDALDFSLVTEAFMFNAYNSFRASETFTAWALRKPSLFEGAFLARASSGHVLSEADIERARTSEILRSARARCA